MEDTADSHKMQFDLEASTEKIKLITQKSPLCNVKTFHHLGLSVNNKAESIIFYSKIGFNLDEEKTNETVTIMKNRGGLEIHLMPCDKPIEDNNNILMDYPTKKYPGHTHVAFTVPNVMATREYLESQSIAITGTRQPPGKRLFSVFARDPDRTTFEFELNHGEPEEGVVIQADKIGYPQCMDHVGIRVSNPEESLLFYAEKLGFVREIGRYEPNPDILKNFAPWISRTLNTGCDINFIINCNEIPSENILTIGNCLRPGIVFVAFSVDDVSLAEEALQAAGVVVVREGDLRSSERWECLANKILPTAGGKSIFLQDNDLNIIRLVEA